VITWDGMVVPCCFDKDASHPLGNLRDQPFKQVWQSDEYKKFRTSLMHSRKNIDICSNCSEGVSVWQD
jgi:radical SAM protein with 4Fe4S-binding SPASM domain